MRDRTLSDRDRRMRIQSLMDGSNPNTILNQLQQEQHQEIQQAAANGLISCSNNDAQAVHAAVATGNWTAMPCVHYNRKCNIIAPCCGKVFGCRVCHDEMTNLAHGPMDRFQVREIVCKECGTRQPRSNLCINQACKDKDKDKDKDKVTSDKVTSDKVTSFAEYHCHICNLWMDTKNRPFHCNKCGICRVGGAENFHHCDLCSMCISVDTVSSHHCMRDKYKNNCPVCREDMYTSRHAPQDLPCGHAIHAHCFRRLAAFDYRCPICKKTVVSSESMSSAWAERAADIERQPMPRDLSRIVDIMCNDCEAKNKSLSWHFLGVQCPGCNSFNTVVENVVSGEQMNDVT